MLNIRQIYTEALTIPADKAGPVELKMREKLKNYPNFHYEDVLVKCCRTAEKTAESEDAQRQLMQTYVVGLGNLVDLMNAYDKSKKDYITQKQKKLVNVDIGRTDNQGNRKTADLDPVKDLGKIRQLHVLMQLVEKLEKIVRGDGAINATFKKYAVTDEDRENIRIIGFNDRAAIWGTKTFEASQKFAVQLWQNIDTIDSGAAYGNPKEQCPYCTHSKNHWDDHAEGDDKYEQYWYLYLPVDLDKKVMSGAIGSLTNPDVVKIYNAMRGLGPELLICQHDSHDDWCDYTDNPISEEGIDIHDAENESDFAYNFNGGFDDVIELYDKFFIGIDRDKIDYAKMPWETSEERDERIRKIFYQQVVYPVADTGRSDGNFNNDNWTLTQINLKAEYFENGKLKFKLPKNVKSLLIGATIDEITSFEGFPEHVEFLTVYNARKISADCNIDFSKTTIQLVIADVNDVYSSYNGFLKGHDIDVLINETARNIATIKESISMKYLPLLGQIGNLKFDRCSIDFSDAQIRNVQNLSIFTSKFKMNPSTAFNTLDELDIYRVNVNDFIANAVYLPKAKKSVRIMLENDNGTEVTLENHLLRQFFDKYDAGVSIDLRTESQTALRSIRLKNDFLNGVKKFDKLTIILSDVLRNNKIMFIFECYMDGKGFDENQVFDVKNLHIENVVFTTCFRNESDFYHIFSGTEIYFVINEQQITSINYNIGYYDRSRYTNKLIDLSQYKIIKIDHIDSNKMLCNFLTCIDKTISIDYVAMTKKSVIDNDSDLILDNINIKNISFTIYDKSRKMSIINSHFSGLIVRKCSQLMLKNSTIDLLDMSYEHFPVFAENTEMNAYSYGDNKFKATKESKLINCKLTPKYSLTIHDIAQFDNCQIIQDINAGTHIDIAQMSMNHVHITSSYCTIFKESENNASITNCIFNSKRIKIPYNHADENNFFKCNFFSFSDDQELNAQKFIDFCSKNTIEADKLELNYFYDNNAGMNIEQSDRFKVNTIVLKCTKKKLDNLTKEDVLKAFDGFDSRLTLIMEIDENQYNMPPEVFTEIFDRDKKGNMKVKPEYIGPDKKLHSKSVISESEISMWLKIYDLIC